MPDGVSASSVSVSEAACDDVSEASGCGDGVALCKLITGGSRSFLAGGGGPKAGLLSCGGGDLRRGETGHRGESLELRSVVDEGFRGCDESRVRGASVPDGGGNVGVVAVDICCCCRGADVGPLLVFCLVLDGLGSLKLLLRDLLTDARPDLAGFANALVGELSLEAMGEAVKEVVAEVHLEGWVSKFALEGAVSWSTEFRL